MLKMLIVDSSVPFTQALVNVFKREFDICVCMDGETALETLLSFRPEILILNLQIPYKDGLTLLQETAYLPPHILVITSYVNTYIEHACADLGVSYVMLCPAVSVLRVRVMDMLRQQITAGQPGNLSASVATHLHILNFKTSMDGYQQLCAAIPLFYADPHQRLTKELYPAVAVQCGNKDGRSVEHSIRKAIRSAWIARDAAVWCKYFPDIKECPTNKLFISRITQMLNL